MRTLFFASIVFVCLFSVFAVWIAPVDAAPEFYTDLREQANAAASEEGAGFGTPRDPRETVALLIRGGLTVVGLLFVGYTIYAGVLILTARGETTKVDKAKSTLRTAVIGILITLSAYSIVAFVSLAIISSNTPDEERSYGSDLNTIFNPLEWFRGIRGNADNGLNQRRFENEDPLNQPRITPFENTSPPWER